MRQEIKVAALVGRSNALPVESEISALVFWDLAFPFGSSPLEFNLWHEEIKFAILDVQRNCVTILHEGEWPANIAFRGNMQNTRAICRSAHACVGDPDHVPHTAPQEFLGNPKHPPPFRHARATLRSCVEKDENGILVYVEVLTVDARLHVLIVVEDDSGAGVLPKASICSYGFDDRTIRGEIAYKIAVPPLSISGLSRSRITAEFNTRAPSRFCPSVWPLTVRQSSFRRSSISAINARSPPA